MKTHLVHLRLDASDKYTSEDFRDLVASLTPNYIITEEISKISKKIHYHCQAYIHSDNTLPSILRRCRRKIKDIHPSISSKKGHYYVARIKSELDSLTYILKDGKTLYSSHMPKEILQQAQEKTETINKEKNQDLKTKITNYIKENYDLPTIQTIQLAVILYHNEKEMLPPHHSIMKRYSAHISYKIIHPICPEQHSSNLKNLYNIQ